MSDHTHWEELAAGYALDALEPDERAEFSVHLETCAQCRELVDEHSLVAAQLGSLAGDDASAAPPWSAIRAGVVGQAQLPGEADVVVLRRRPRVLTLAAAAAAVVVVGAGVATWQLRGAGNTSQPLASVSACRSTTGCHVVTLQAGSGATAAVLVHDGSVAVVPTSMPAPPAGSVWALWQLPRTGAPRLLTEFTTGRQSASLQMGYADTAGFAVSRERAGTTPTAPSQVVASGTT